jgi:hypothetical protein
VKIVDADDRLWAVKDMPPRVAALARDVIPPDWAATMAIAQVPTAPFEVLRDD